MKNNELRSFVDGVQNYAQTCLEQALQNLRDAEGLLRPLIDLMGVAPLNNLLRESGVNFQIAPSPTDTHDAQTQKTLNHRPRSSTLEG